MQSSGERMRKRSLHIADAVRSGRIGEGLFVPMPGGFGRALVLVGPSALPQ